MDQTLTLNRTPDLIALVLDPELCHDALLSAARQEGLGHDDAEQLAALLPLAIAQLDAIGDEYGIMALEELFDQLPGLEHAV